MRRLKEIAKYTLPVYEVISAAHSFCLHMRYSFGLRGPVKDKEAYKYFLVKSYHIVEKGLALPAPRKCFGVKKLLKLIKFTEQYVNMFGVDQLVLDILSALEEYKNYHISIECADCEVIPEIGRIKILIDNARSSGKGKGGVKRITTQPRKTLTFEELMRSRCSVRDFSEDALSAQEALKLVSISKYTPSVCNRQGWKAYAYDNQKKIQELLLFQNGNTGFGKFPVLLLLVGKVRAFSRFEHNQLFIDGGMFSMSVLLALEAAGLASCPLNLAITFEVERQLKKAAGIPPEERPIMMIAVGKRRSDFLVAASPRFNDEDIFVEG